MPHLTHKRVPGVFHQPSSIACHLTSPHEPPSSEQNINYDGWPDFPPPQSLSDDTAQLHLTLQSPSPSHSASVSPSPSRSPGSSPLLSRQSSSGGVTPESGGSASPDLSVVEKQNAKKKNRLSAAALASLLPVHHDGDKRRARRERKRTDKLVRHEQTLQELRTADRRRGYFRDALHRRELIFGPEVRYASPTTDMTARLTYLFWKDVFTTDFCYGFIQFAPTLSLHLPGGISFDLMHYWDGQPVRFMCCERKREAEIASEEGGVDEVPWGRVLWCVAIEPLSDEEESQLAPQSQPRSQTASKDGEPQHSLAGNIDESLQVND